MTDIRDAALGFEAIKVAMRQTKDGIAITLLVHPNDTVTQVFADPVGARYQVALVRLDEDDAPMDRKSEGDIAVERAGALARNPRFQQWVTELDGQTAGEEEAAEFIRRYCNVASRAELRTHKNGREAFDILSIKFSRAIREKP